MFFLSTPLEGIQGSSGHSGTIHHCPVVSSDTSSSVDLSKSEKPGRSHTGRQRTASYSLWETLCPKETACPVSESPIHSFCYLLLPQSWKTLKTMFCQFWALIRPNKGLNSSPKTRREWKLDHCPPLPQLKCISRSNHLPWYHYLSSSPALAATESWSIVISSESLCLPCALLKCPLRHFPQVMWMACWKMDSWLHFQWIRKLLKHYNNRFSALLPTILIMLYSILEPLQISRNLFFLPPHHCPGTNP